MSTGFNTYEAILIIAVLFFLFAIPGGITIWLWLKSSKAPSQS
jgi:hypothetical protein